MRRLLRLDRALLLTSSLAVASVASSACGVSVAAVDMSATGSGGAETTPPATTTASGAGGADFWSRRFGDAGPQWPSGLAVSPAGTIAVSGSFAGTIDLGAGALTYQGPGYGSFLAAFDAAGHPRWRREFPTVTSGFLPVRAFAFAGEDLVVAGGVFGTVDLGDLGADPLGSAGLTDVFVARFDAAGEVLWARRFGGAGDQLATSVAVDPFGNIVVAGAFSGALDFGGDALDADPNSGATFLAKLDGAGQPLAARAFGPGVSLPSVGVDGGGNIVLTGQMEGSVDFGLGPIESAGFMDVFVARFDPALKPLVIRRFGDSSPQTLIASAVDPAGDVVLTGFSKGGIDFGAGPLFAPGGSGCFAAKLDAEGAVVWTKTVPQPAVLGPVALDATGRTMLGGSGMLVQTLDAAGNVLGTRSQDQGGVPLTGLASSPGGAIVLTGILGGTSDLGFGPLTSKGMEDVVLAQLAFP